MKKQLQKAGFTLIELIVVIAILGVLAGGAAVGYSGYVKKANKAADQQLVGSIERALDVGSYAFDIDNVLQLGGEGLKLPVGFVVLKADGNAEAMESGSSVKAGGNVCKTVQYSEVVGRTIGGIQIDYVVGTIQRNRNSESYWLTQSSTKCSATGRVCLTHIDLSNVVTADEKDESGNMLGKVGVLVIGEEDRFHTFAHLMDSTQQGWEKHKNSEETSTPLESVSQIDAGGLKSDGELANAMAAAFGAGWENELRLKYDGWTADGMDAELPSLYAGSSEFFDKLQSIIDDAQRKVGMNDYDVANHANYRFDGLVGQDEKYPVVYYHLTEQDICSAWEQISKSDAGTQFDGTPVWKARGAYYGNENSMDDMKKDPVASAVTAMMYNAGFTTWMQQSGKYNDGHTGGVLTKNDAGTGDSIGDTLVAHIDAILDWGDQTTGYDTNGMGNNPYTICAGAFDDAKSRLPVRNCPTCKKAYEEYASSGAWKANASAAYKTMKTISDTGDEALAYAKNGTIGFFDYYKNYMDEFGRLYSGIQNNDDGSCIIIAVYRTGSGTMDYDVYPAAADPRKS